MFRMTDAGASDCALFTIAFALALCEGDDQHKSSTTKEVIIEW